MTGWEVPSCSRNNSVVSHVDGLFPRIAKAIHGISLDHLCRRPSSGTTRAALGHTASNAVLVS